MLKAYQLQSGGLRATEILEGAPIAPDTIWIDLHNPSVAERQAVNALLGMELPTRADMEEIEVSSRLYTEDGGVFMTALVLSNADSDRPVADVVTFVLAREKLITIRYIDPQPFRTFAARCERAMVAAPKAEDVLKCPARRDRGPHGRRAGTRRRGGRGHQPRDLQRQRSRLGAARFPGRAAPAGRPHDLTGKMRECLLTMSRMLTFLSAAIDSRASKEARAHVKSLSRDVQSLLDHSSVHRQQARLSAGRHAGAHQQRAEQHHQDHVGRGDGVPAADLDRLDLRHEFPLHA